MVRAKKTQNIEFKKNNPAKSERDKYKSFMSEVEFSVFVLHEALQITTLSLLIEP